jgi:hypothetical protein
MLLGSRGTVVAVRLVRDVLAQPTNRAPSSTDIEKFSIVRIVAAAWHKRRRVVKLDFDSDWRRSPSPAVLAESLDAYRADPFPQCGALFRP